MPDLLLPLPSRPADHQQACVVLVDLVGSTRLAHQLPLAAYAALMAEVVQLLILSCEVRGGQVLQHQGDAVLALWPAERSAHGVTAALDSHGRVARLGLAEMLGVRLQVRAGVAVGELVVGPVGGQPSAYGLPVNYVRRLCDVASPGETLVCERVAQQYRRAGPLEVRPLPPLRGFGPEVRAYTVPETGGTSEQMKTG